MDWLKQLYDRVHQASDTVRQGFYENFTVTGLKVAIIAWAIVVIIAVLFIDNPWLLAGILAYEILP